MGEHADEYYRREVMSRHGFDPGSMYKESKPKNQQQICPVPGCDRQFKPEQAIKDHLIDYHGITDT